MSTMLVETGDGWAGGQEYVSKIKRRLQDARDYRKRFEPTWHSNLAFAAGKYWLEWDRFNRQLVMPADLKGKELYTADVITEYRMAALGELGSDDDRPELLLRRDDRPSEDFQAQLNKAVGFGWDHEWEGDACLDELDRLLVDLGTAGVQCYFDPAVGPTVADNVPHLNGKPVLDPDQAASLLGDGPNPQVKMRPIRQGRICWRPLSPFNMLVPPGVPNERYFPWEATVTPVPLEKVQAEYGELAADLKEDADIGSILGLDQQAADVDARSSGAGPAGRLRDHVWLFRYFERPSSQWPKGRVVTLATNRMVPLRIDDQLPYQAPDGEWRSGISYFHWWRVTGRFWSRALVEVMKDSQRGVNKRRTQINEIIDRGMPFVIVQKDSAALNRKGTPVEFVEVDRQEAPPVVNPGVAPGAWLQADVEAMREDLDHATGIKGVRLGENPANVTTYSQLALINENDQGKRQTIVAARKAGIARLVEDSVHDIRTYWGPQREIMLASDDDRIDAAIFDATKIPAFFIVKVAKGSARPRSQAAELQKIEDIARYSLESSQPVPVAWFKASLEAGEALDLPDSPSDDQADKAQLENHMLLAGTPVSVDYFDPPATHIPLHRAAQIQARMAGEQPAFDAFEQHIQEHLAVAQEQAAKVQAAAQPSLGAAGVAPAAGSVPAGPAAASPSGPAFPPQGEALNRPL